MRKLEMERSKMFLKNRRILSPKIRGALKSRLSAIVTTLLLPTVSWGDCDKFEPFDSGGNYHKNIDERVNDVLSCPDWTLNQNVSGINHAQGFIVGSLISQQDLEQALAQANIYFSDARRRYEKSFRQPNYDDILSAEGKLHSILSSNLMQTGMLLSDVASQSIECGDIAALDYLLEITQKDIKEYSSRIWANTDQRLSDYTLAEWQEYYPDAKSKHEIREILAPELENLISQSADADFMLLFTTNIRVEGGSGEKCLAHRFIEYTKAEGMAEADIARRFPRTLHYLFKNGL